MYLYVWGTVCFLFFLSLLVHEWGHIAELKKYYNYVPVWWDGKDLNVGQEWQYAALHPLDRGAVYLYGVLWGFAPLIIIVFIDRWLFIAFALIYLYGCKHDLTMLWKIKSKGL